MMASSQESKRVKFSKIFECDWRYSLFLYLLEGFGILISSFRPERHASLAYMKCSDMHVFNWLWSNFMNEKTKLTFENVAFIDLICGIPWWVFLLTYLTAWVKPKLYYTRPQTLHNCHCFPLNFSERKSSRHWALFLQMKKLFPPRGDTLDGVGWGMPGKRGCFQSCFLRLFSSMPNTNSDSATCSSSPYFHL